MKKIVLAFLLLGAFMAKAQEVQNDTIKPTSIESLKESIDDHSMKIEGYGERLAAIESDIAKLTKIKISGYAQIQYDMYDIWGADGHGLKVATTSPTPAPVITNSFYIRRARVKFTYEALDGVKFVISPDFAFDKVQLKDAYIVLNDRWLQTFSLTMGQFNRLNYEVEYSSSSREVLERTRMITALYPGERELGAKFEANFETKYQLPLKLQLAAFNGNFALGTTANQVRDVDNTKDIMARALYSVKLPSSGLGIDFGAHGYFGKTEILPGTTLTGFTNEDNVAFTPKVGDQLDRSWMGGEIQIYYDFLGGTALKGEYISGTISGTTNVNQTNSGFAGNRVRDFNGFYATFIKNIGTSHQFAVRYDVFDPNTKLSGNQVKTAADLKYSTWSFAWQYFFDDNVKIIAGYTLPTNEKSTNVGVAGGEYNNRDKRDNVFSLRLQAKF